MSDKAVGGPGAVDLFGIGGFWVAQDDGNNDTSQRAVGIGSNGDAAASKLHDNKNEVTVTYKNFATAGNLVIPAVGDVLGGYVAPTIKIDCKPEDWPTMVITGHQHDGNPHVAGLPKYVFPLTIPCGFGVPTIFANLAAACGNASLSVDLSCTHLDVPDGLTGEHLAGSNGNGQCKVSLEYTGVPNITADVANKGFDFVTPSNKTHGNSKFDATSCQLEKSLARV